jgi:hypothetical protein
MWVFDGSRRRRKVKQLHAVEIAAYLRRCFVAGRYPTCLWKFITLLPEILEKRISQKKKE